MSFQLVMRLAVGVRAGHCREDMLTATVLSMLWFFQTCAAAAPVLPTGMRAVRRATPGHRGASSQTHRCLVSNPPLLCLKPTAALPPVRCRHEGEQPSCGLRLVILDALLRTEPSFMLPPWLMRAFRVSSMC